MKIHILKKLFICCILFFSFTVAGVEIVVNKNSVEATREDILRAYTGRLKFWPNKIRAVIVILPIDNTISIEFFNEKLKLNVSAIKDLYNSINDNSQGVKVKEANTESGMFITVSNTLGSVGYLKNVLLINRGMDYIEIIPY